MPLRRGPSGGDQRPEVGCEPAPRRLLLPDGAEVLVPRLLPRPRERGLVAIPVLKPDLEARTARVQRRLVGFVIALAAVS